MTYPRVVPRDLFNEAKLLKCLGKLVLRCFTPEPDIEETDERILWLSSAYDGQPFDIRQRPECGGLYCANLRFFFGKVPLEVYTTYNSKSAYPLCCDTKGPEGEIAVFDENGELSDDFQQFTEMK